MLGGAFAVLGVHGAGWANLVFVGEGAHAIEMALPEPHAIYTAHTAYALGLEYWHIPLRGNALHSAAYISAPVERVAQVLRQVVAAQSEVVVMELPPPSMQSEAMAMTPRIHSTELVVARYDEDVEWCKPFNCTVYNKGATIPLGRAPGFRLVGLPNIGRESHTWLTHIVDQWTTLADNTVFMQVRGVRSRF